MHSHARVRGIWSRRGARARSTIAAVSVVAIALLVGGGVMVVVLNVALTHSIRLSVEQRLQDVAAQIAEDHVEEAGATVAASPGDNTVVQVIGVGGTVLLASPAITGEPAILPGGKASAAITTQQLPLPFVDNARYLVASVQSSSLDGPVSVVAAQSLAPVERVVRLVIVLLLAGSPFLLAAVAAITWLAVGRSLGSVDRIRARVETIGGRDLVERVPVPESRDEIARLAVTMNHMLDRLESSAVAQRQFVADASHELKSPLASMRASLDVAQASTSGDVWAVTEPVLSDEVDRMTRLVADLLLLAKADEGALSMRHVDVDLDDLVADEVRRLRAQTALTVTTRIDPVRVVGDPARLAQALRNLVDNAARFSHAQIRLGVHASDTSATLTVEDDGPGIPIEGRDLVLRRFVRIDGHRARDHGGTGLGLAITAEIVRLHDGEVVIAQSDLGGAQVSLVLPAASSR